MSPLFLLHARAVISLVQNQLVEDGQYLFPIVIHAPQRIAESGFVPARAEPLLQQRLRDIDVSTQSVGGVTSQKEPVEHCRLALRGQWIEIFPGCHANYFAMKKASINTIIVMNQEGIAGKTLDLFVLWLSKPILPNTSKSIDSSWHHTCTSTGMRDRYLLILLAVLLVLSIGVFFFYVPILPVVASVVVLIGLVAMFSLGFHLGQNTRAVPVEMDGSKSVDLPLPHATVPSVRDRFRDVA